MAETIRYALIGAEDLNVGSGTFEVRLADGRVVQMNQISLLTLPSLVPSYATTGDLPTASTAGRLARVGQALYLDNGSAWEVIASAAYTATAIPYGGSAGALTEDSTNLNYDSTGPTLNVPANVYTVGSGTNVNLAIRPKGSTGTITLADGSGNEVIKTVAAVASAVNEISFTNAATGNGPILSTTGDDSAPPLNITPKGNASVRINGTGALLFPNNANIGTSGGSTNPTTLYLVTSVVVPTVTSPTDTALVVKTVAVTGTDTAGKNLTLSAGTSTGTGVGGVVVIQTSPSATSSGSAANTLVDRVVWHAKSIDLVKSVATEVFYIQVPTTLTGVGGSIHYSIDLNDGTNVQCQSGSVYFAVVNKAGTLSTDIDVDTRLSLATSSGTFAVPTWSATTSGTTATLLCSAAPSLTPTVMKITMMVILNSTYSGWSYTFY